MISVVVVDDEHLVRSGFAALLASDPEITVVGTAESGNAAVAVVRRERPEVVLMDIRMPGRDGVSATAAITADPALSRTRVIVLTTFDLDEYVHAALRAGASGFLLKDTQPHELLAAIHLVAQGESVLSPTLVRRLIAAFVETPTPASKPAWLDSLTARESEVLVAVAQGLSNAEIGAMLHMSAATSLLVITAELRGCRRRRRTRAAVQAQHRVPEQLSVCGQRLGVVHLSPLRSACGCGSTDETAPGL
jgi:DNA-binding NarL/FixJ family response regulator